MRTSADCEPSAVTIVPFVINVRIAGSLQVHGRLFGIGQDWAAIVPNQ
jgi:hypothetical protein